MYSAKTAEPIEMPFGTWDQRGRGQVTMYYIGDWVSPWEGAIWGRA